MPDLNERIGYASLGLGVLAWMWAATALLLVVRPMLLDAPAGVLVAGFLVLGFLGFAMGILALVRAARRERELPTSAVIGTYVSGMALVVAGAALLLIIRHA